MDKGKSVTKYYHAHERKRAIQQYGFAYSDKKYMIYMTGTILTVLMLCLLMRIKPAGICAVLLSDILIFPVITVYHYRGLYEERRFTDAVSYMEYVIYGFLRMPKIVNTLEEVQKLCRGNMKKCIEKAVDRIQYADVYNNIYADAFSYIEKEYGTARMSALHRFLVQVELQGGEYTQALEVLLEDVRQWSEMVSLLQKERKELQRKVSISIGLSITTAITMVGLLPKEIGNIAESSLYQVSSVAFLLSGMMIFVLSRKSLLRSWLESEQKEEEVDKAYDYCMEESNIKRKHYRFMRKKVECSIAKEFPMWLRNVILHMQTENVFVAMSKAAQELSYPLKNELLRVLGEIEKYPGSMQAYEKFLEKFDLKQIKNVFLMFYSFNEFGAKEAQEQLNAMIQRNNKLSEQSERLMNEESLGIYGVYMLMPMVIAAGKMLLDMWVFVQQFLFYYSNVVV